MIGLSMDTEVKLPPDFEEHIASIKWSMRPFANRSLFKIDHQPRPCNFVVWGVEGGRPLASTSPAARGAGFSHRAPPQASSATLVITIMANLTPFCLKAMLDWILLGAPTRPGP